MTQIATNYDTKGEDKLLREDIKKLRDAHNLSEKLIEIDGRTSDPVGLPTTSVKVYLFYRTDTNQLSAYVNGSFKRVTLS